MRLSGADLRADRREDGAYGDDPRRALIDSVSRSRFGRGAAVALIIGLSAGCVPTARTSAPYEFKAASAAEAVHSAVESDLLVLQAVRRGHVTAALVSVATSDAEDAASSSASSFMAIQPPHQANDDLRSRASNLFDDAQSTLGDARMAGRRGDRSGLEGTRPELEHIAAKLESFVEDHQK
jgi:hypothetical protein